MSCLLRNEWPQMSQVEIKMHSLTNTHMTHEHMHTHTRHICTHTHTHTTHEYMYRHTQHMNICTRMRVHTHAYARTHTQSKRSLQLPLLHGHTYPVKHCATVHYSGAKSQCRQILHWYSAGGCTMSHNWRCEHPRSHLDLTHYVRLGHLTFASLLTPGPH